MRGDGGCVYMEVGGNVNIYRMGDVGGMGRGRRERKGEGR